MPIPRLISAFIYLLFLTTASHALADPIERKHLGDWEKDLGYTQTVKVGDMLYLSGITSGAATMPEQIQEIYSTIQSILQEYGANADDVVKETVYTLDIDLLQQHAAERKKFYANGLYPAATWLQIDRLIVPGLLLEVEVMVKIPEISVD